MRAGGMVRDAMWAARKPATGLALLFIVGAVGLFFMPTSVTSMHADLIAQPGAPARAPVVAAASVSPALNVPSAVAGLTLGITASPSRICAYDTADCPAGTGESKVTLTAVAGLQGLETWPAVQVAFVIETTLFDGVYDPTADDPGHDPCAACGQYPTCQPCEESNGVPFFVAHAQQIANAIQSANPHSAVSFALVDYFATKDAFDDGDGSKYNVDIPAFIPASQFGAQVQGTFQADELGGGYVYGDSDFSDNILHSSSITALYGAIIGSGLDWSPDVHHVIVWMGSTVPEDPSYVANYCVTPSDYGSGFSGCTSTSCEPSYAYGAVSSPNCEGWVRSPDQNVSHSIAGLARTTPQCTQSIGSVCTIDTIDLYDGMDDGCSKDWPVYSATTGPCKSTEMNDAAKVIEAGCDLAAATGGSWDGPNFASCPNGQQGTLLPVFDTNAFAPNTQNPTLLAALRGVSFGPVIDTVVANGTGRPLFTYVPIGNIRPAATPEFHASCIFGDGLIAHCPSQPVRLITPNGVPYFGWNWSNNSTTNVMHLGDTWSVSFYVIANGPPYSLVPVDACILKPFCQQAQSSSEGGVYTWASYIPVTNKTVVTISFPVAQVNVMAAEAPAPPPPVPPPAPPPPPPFAIPVGPALPVVQPIGVAAQVGLGSVALQGVAAGFLAAGFLRVGMKNRPISMAVAAKSGVNPTSRFERGQMEANQPGLGRFE
jgi:hypothetical protein